MQIENRKTNVEASVALAKMAFGDDDPKVGFARDIANDCIDTTDEDRCEAAFKMYECGFEAGKKRGIDFTDIM